MASAFIDAGQRCASGSRIIVFDRVYDAFREALLARVDGGEGRLGPGRRLRAGDLARRASIGCSRTVERRRGARRARCSPAASAVDVAGARLLHGADGARERRRRTTRSRSRSCSGRSRACIASTDFDEAVRARQRDDVRPDRRDSHRRHAPHRGVHRALSRRPRVDQRRRPTAPARTCRLAA